MSRRTAVVFVLVLSVVLGALGLAGYSLFTVSQDRNGWRQVAHDLQAELDGGQAVQACRSQANLDTDKAAAELSIIIGQSLGAVGRREDLAPFLVNLDGAVTNLRRALDDRQVSLETCQNLGARP